MNADEARAEAVRSLAARLRAWQVPNPEQKATVYVADMFRAGWRWFSPENRPAPPRAADECDRHQGEWATRCRGCAADELAADQTHPADPRRHGPAEHLALARAALASARANARPETDQPDAEEATR